MRQSIKTYLKVILNLVTALIVLLLCIFLLPKCIFFFMPFVIGWIISLIASPVVRFFEEKLKVRRKGASVIVIVAVLSAVILIVYAVGAKLVQEGVSFVNELPMLWEGIMDEFSQVGENLEGIYNRLPEDMQNTLDNIGTQMGEYFGSIMEGAGTPTFEAVGNVAKQLPDIFLGVVMCILSAYFFVADKSYMSNIMKKYVPDSIRYRFDLIRRSFRNAVGGYFKAQFKIECWIYILLVVGLLALHVRYALLVALGIAFLDFLPVFGTGTVMIPWAVIEILSKDYKMAIGLLIVWCVGQLVRQMIQPKIVGDSIGMDAIPTLFLLFIGYKVAGVLGMILAVPIGIIVVNLYEEGVFDTTKQSVQILVAGYNKFRRIRPEDTAIVEAYEKEVEKSYQKELESVQEGEREKEEASQIKIEEPLIIKKIISKKSERDDVKSGKSD
ncbi:MAG: sporulation integral membrane protein YtvI [Lachnospiraceae bacterium]|nr:sporulation integral membrane protein YtvI [Lachnospiraceae bacterium]